MTSGSSAIWQGPIAFVLGAGFSRALAEQMPLTDELGVACLAKLANDLPPRLALEELASGVTFESWLSELATEQPYLSEAVNAQNRAAFLLFSEAIADILNERVMQALRHPYPEWLMQLAIGWHHHLCGVITFNYDPLIECLVATPTGAFGRSEIYGTVWNGVAWTELTGDLPPLAPGAARLGATRVNTFRLLKLHGSLNWYWRPGDESGATVARRTLPGHFGQPQPYDDESRRREVPGRMPFVVPPSSSKSQYYLNPITREMWTQAAERLRAAGTVVIAGYSLPPTDVTFSNLLRETVTNRDCRIIVADYEPGPVRVRLEALSIGSERIEVLGGGKEAIPLMVNSWCQALSTEVLGYLLNNADPSVRLMLAWGDNRAYSPLSRVERTSDAFIATAATIDAEFNAAADATRQPALTVAQLREYRRGGTADKVPLAVRTTAQDALQPVVGLHGYQINTGRGDGRWLVVQVAATPPPLI